MDTLSALAQVEVLTPQGKPVFFEEAYSGQTSVIAFVRHFGCVFCFEQVSELFDVEPELRRLGARLVVVGNGNPAHALFFMERTGLEGHVYTDPARITYRALSFRRGVRATFNYRSTRYAAKALQRGFRQTGTRGDRWQQGGVLLVSGDGEIHYCHRSEVAGDKVPLDDLLARLRQLSPQEDSFRL